MPQLLMFTLAIRDGGLYPPYMVRRSTEIVFVCEMGLDASAGLGLVMCYATYIDCVPGAEPNRDGGRTSRYHIVLPRVPVCSSKQAPRLSVRGLRPGPSCMPLCCWC